MSGMIGIIPARYASSRFPGKPLAKILGKSLIQRTFESVSASRLDKVIVATDDQRIFDHVKGFGGEVIMTSPSCQTGTDRLAEALEACECDAEIIINIQGDWPCIEPHVIEAVGQLLYDDQEAVMGTAVIQLTDPLELLSPSRVKCVFDNQDRALYFSRSPIPYPRNLDLNKSLPPELTYWGHLGIYSYRKEFLKNFAQRACTPLQEREDLEQLKVLEYGDKIKIVRVESVGLSVDTPEDLGKVEQYLCSQSTSLSQAVSSLL